MEAVLLHALGWREWLELLLIGYATYRILRKFHGTRVLRIVAGMAILAAIYAAAWLLHLSLITYLLGLGFQYGAIALLIVFAPELRAGLAHLGEARFARLFTTMEQREVSDEIYDAVERLSRSSIGAIVAIEREVPLDGFAESGSAMDAKVSADLVTTIFTPYSPLHDGAVIIRGDTIIAAGCILPLSQKAIVDRALGTRHRAALGLSEESDALVLVVSEERATISIAERGRLWRDLSPLEVRGVLAGRVPSRDPVGGEGAAAATPLRSLP
ncbi:MAG: diadenylate cyclase CdaA [Gemmatimonadota bacterium]